MGFVFPDDVKVNAKEVAKNMLEDIKDVLCMCYLTREDFNIIHIDETAQILIKDKDGLLAVAYAYVNGTYGFNMRDYIGEWGNRLSYFLKKQEQVETKEELLKLIQERLL